MLRIISFWDTHGAERRYCIVFSTFLVTLDHPLDCPLDCLLGTLDRPLVTVVVRHW